jgi:hypothetical protein
MSEYRERVIHTETNALNFLTEFGLRIVVCDFFARAEKNLKGALNIQ